MSNFLDKTGLSYFWGKIKSGFIALNGGGTAQMDDSLGNGPYTIVITEEADSEDVAADEIAYNPETTGLTAKNVQDAVDELATKVHPISKGGTGVSTMTGTDYTTNRPRGIILQETEPDSVPNGCIVGVYE